MQSFLAAAAMLTLACAACRPVAWKRELREEADRIRRRDERRAREEEDRKVSWQHEQISTLMLCFALAW
jgi:hypothetical protein